MSDTDTVQNGSEKTYDVDKHNPDMSSNTLDGENANGGLDEGEETHSEAMDMVESAKSEDDDTTGPAVSTVNDQSE